MTDGIYQGVLSVAECTNRIQTDDGSATVKIHAEVRDRSDGKHLRQNKCSEITQFLSGRTVEEEVELVNRLAFVDVVPLKPAFGKRGGRLPFKVYFSPEAFSFRLFFVAVV